MLIHKDLQGDAAGLEHSELKGMLQVGNEFMTHRREGSEIQRAGQFVEMKKRAADGLIELIAFFETPDPRRAGLDGSLTLIGDDEARLDPSGLFQRGRLFAATRDEEVGVVGPEFVSGFRSRSRASRYTKVEQRLNDVEHTTQSGRGRVWHLGDGENLLMVREVIDTDLDGPPDARYFMGVTRNGISARRNRVVGVELVKVNAERGRDRQVLMYVETFSGLGFNPGNRAIAVVDAAGSPAMFDANFVYTGRAGHLWGRFTQAGYRMDPSASYAVAEPSQHPEKFLSLVAVHCRAEDALHPDSSIVTRLTCSFTTKEGNVGAVKIPLPPHGDPLYQWSVIETELLRVSPLKLLLRVLLGAVLADGPAPGAPNGGSSFAFYWSEDDGRTWVRVNLDNIASYKGSPQQPVAMMVGRGGAALLFTTYVDVLVDAYDEDMIVIHSVTATGAATIGTINASVFSAGLDSGYAFSGRRRYPRYFPVSFGGGFLGQRPDKSPVEMLWMQFDPFAIYAATSPSVIQYPSARAMLMVSADGGATWERRLLPEPWPQRVGFVANADRTALMVPVYAARVRDGGSLKNVGVQVRTSKAGGKTWSNTPMRFTLPAVTFVDGQMVPGTPAYDISDYRDAYNRGEIFPLVAIRNSRGDVLPTNPGRPWISDAGVKEPENG